MKWEHVLGFAAICCVTLCASILLGTKLTPSKPKVETQEVWILWSYKNNFMGDPMWLREELTYTLDYKCREQAQERSNQGILSECRKGTIPVVPVK